MPDTQKETTSTYFHPRVYSMREIQAMRRKRIMHECLDTLAEIIVGIGIACVSYGALVMLMSF